MRSWISSATIRWSFTTRTFDVGFLNMELERIGKPALQMTRVVDTLALARRKHPGAPATLDALCRRYDIDNTQRTKHGAIVDCLLLAQVYVELLGERQASLVLGASGSAASGDANGRASGRSVPARQRAHVLPPRLSEDDLKAHQAFVETLGPHALWKRMAG